MTKFELETRLSNHPNIQELAAMIDNAEDDEAVLEILKQNGLELTEKEILALTDSGDELDEDALENVAGGKCQCRGILKRILTNFIFWMVERVTGNRPTCLDCGH